MTNPNTHPAPTMVYGGAPSFQDAPNPDPFCDNAPPSKFDLATVEYRDESPAEGYDFTLPVGPNTPTAPNPFADLRAGLDAAKRLREHLPGDSPELQQADDTIAALEAAIDAAEPATEEPEDDLAYLRMLNRKLRNQAGGAHAELRAAKRELAGLAEENGAMQDELATLRAENERLKAIWEAGHTEAMEAHIALNQEVAQCDELRADNAARGVLIDELREEMNEAYAACDKMAVQRNGYMTERDQARAERDIARANVAAADRRNEVLAAELDTVRSERDAAREELTAAKMSADLQRAANHRLRVDRDHNYDRWQQTLRALNAALGEP